MPPGLLVLWCGRAPCWHIVQLGDRDVVVGRDLLDSLGLTDRDRRISGQHARISRTGGGLQIEDMGSRNGTYVGGEKVRAPTPLVPPTVVRIGQTIALAVGDTGYYAKTPVHEVNGLVVGPGSLHLHHRLDQLARGTAHVVLVGLNGSGRRELARHYARARQQPFVMFDSLGSASLADAVEPGTRTVIFPEINRLRVGDRATLAALLDQPNMRVVSTSQTRLDNIDRENPPPELVRRLQGEVVQLPVVADRIEEVPLLIARTAERVAPQLAVHSSAIEWALTYRWPGNWLELVHGVTACARGLIAQGAKELRDRDLARTITKDHVVIGARPTTVPE